MLMVKNDKSTRVTKTKTTVAKKPAATKAPAKVASVAVAEPAPVRDRRLWLIPAVLLTVIALGLGIWKYMDQQKQLDSLKQATKSAQDINKEAAADLASIAVVPEGEEPVVREVEEVESLAKQPFYAQAQIGDRVLLYTKAKRAYLYRPSAKKVVNISNNIVVQGANEEAAPTTPAQ